MPISPSPPPLISVPRITTLIASLIVATSAATKYVYSVYSPQLGARLNLSHTQLNFIGLSASFGSALTSPIWGRITDSHGPRIPLACAVVFHLIGYAYMKQIYDSGLPAHVDTLPISIFVALIFCTSLVGSGGNAAGMAAENTTAKTFPDRARGSTTGLVISGFGLSPFVFTTISHFFFAGDTSALLLLLTLGTSGPMIMGFFLVRPIPLPVPLDSDMEESRDQHQHQLEARSSALDPHDSSSTPLLDHDSFADDIPPNGSFISSQSNREVAIPKPNLHGRHLWTSSDFWLLFSILSILSGTGLMYINNVGAISQVLYAHENSKYDKVKALGWQAAQVSITSLMSFSGRILIGLVSDLIKNRYKLPRSYLLVPIATLFFVSQLILATVGSISRLWIASLLLGLAYGSLFSLYPILCMEYFGMAHFSENWGYLGVSILVGGNIFSFVFGRNLDAHDRPLLLSQPPSIDPVQCLEGLHCYVAAIYLTLSATFVAMVLCFWAGYREKQRIRKL